ncbi:MAG: efflux RND transporter periplasmic adaptor subunit, partial [Planctomycetales bacterium]|nr:efflux RND transporter periplasmic adaptor subunit [Planctomycetales bacterium]
DPGEFYHGFLPRLCAAMGAKAAAVWRMAGSDSGLQLVAGHSLPSALLDTTHQAMHESELQSTHATESVTAEFSSMEQATLASPSHERILRCVVAEGQPILVPPGSVKIEADRPHNPLSEALIIIPVRIQEEVEFLLEVIQRPSGGPAAQRGYLRFVAQMADLMADYLRRQQLREFQSDRDRLRRIEGWLTALAGASGTAQCQALGADALRDLFAADRVVVISNSLRCKVTALSGARNFDPRSEIILAAEALLRKLLSNGQLFQAARDDRPGGWLPQRLLASNRRTGATGKPVASSVDERLTESSKAHGVGTPTDHSPSSREHALQEQAAVDAFCHGLACRQAVVLPLDGYGGQWAILAYAEESSEPPLDIAAFDGNQSLRLARSIGGLMVNHHATAGVVGWLATVVLGRRSSGSLTKFAARYGIDQRAQKAQESRRLAMLWLMRLALAGLLVAIACFPVSQQVTATAILQPRNKQMYYAPAAAIVTQVMADEGEVVQVGTPLMRLTSHELTTQVESLQIELEKTQGDMEEKTSRLNRGDNLSPLQRDQLEFNLRELDTTLHSLQLQLSDAQQREQELSISARADGTIATWDLKNRLLNHPVQAGQLLASTFDPDDQWSLLLSIPDHRAGLVSDALENSAQGAVKVHFSLASHPDQVLQAFAVNMAPQVTVHGSDPNAATARVVKTEALMQDAAVLPLKKDGAIARASIDCGRVPLCWLIFRDAAWAMSSRIRMLW